MSSSSDLESRSYLRFEPGTGYPARKKLFYECGRCGDSLPSAPVRAMACTCRNIVVDADAGRISVKFPESVRLFEVRKMRSRKRSK